MSLTSASIQQFYETTDWLMAPVGGYSLEKLLLITAVAAVLLVLGPLLIGAFRGSSRNIARAATRDVLIGIACVIPVITFLGFFFFVGRGYLTAIFSDSE